MNQIKKIGFLGGGRMAQAMANGFISTGLLKSDSIIASVHPSDTLSLNNLKKMGIQAVTKNEIVVNESNVCFLLVKPQVMPTVLQEIQPISDNKLFISIAMGVRLDNIESKLSNTARVIRVMPNTPALVQKACSALTRGTNATDSDCDLTLTLLKAIGTCEEVPESYLDTITALSGSGPAYVYVMIEALADGAVHMGLPRDLAYRFASQTVLGAGYMVRDTGEHPATLKDNVTSPAGSTAAGLKHLENSAFRAAVAGAVEMATLRCRETANQ